MNEDRTDPVRKLLDLIAEHLESWRVGEEIALETLGEAILARGFTPDQLESAILALKSLAGTSPSATSDMSLPWTGQTDPSEWGAGDGEATH